MAYARAIMLLSKRKLGIHAVTMLSMARVTEQLKELESALQLYRSAYVLAREVNKTDLAVVAESGVRRLNGKVGIQAIRPEPRAVANVSSAKPKTR